MPASVQRCKYRKLNEGGWGLFGPAAELVEGRIVSVRKGSGELKEERVGKVVSRPISIDGTPHVYARIADRAQDPVVAAVAEMADSRNDAYAPVATGLCAECLKTPGVRECRDASGLKGMCCLACSRLPYTERSFA